jgi:hypothetical protein
MFAIRENNVNLSIPQWWNIYMGENSALGKQDANLPIVGVLLC